AGGADIRFSTSSGGTPWNYWIESGTGTSSTKVWLKAPSLAGSGSQTVYMYYGHASTSAWSSLENTFTFGDSFTGADGSVPNPGKWNGIQSGSPAGGSARELQGNRLRLRFGSSGGTLYYGLRSASRQIFTTGRRYRFLIQAGDWADGSQTLLTLCPTSAQFSAGQTNWLRFLITHSATPEFRLEKRVEGTSSALAVNNTGVGFHDVQLLINSSSLTVYFDGTEIYNGSHGLSFTDPYVYLEAGSASGALRDHVLDDLFAAAWTPPEPAHSFTGAEQGGYPATGNYVSAVFDAAQTGTRVTWVDWLDSTSTATSVAFDVRAHDTDTSQAAWTAADRGADPGPLATGRLLQYRARLSSTDPRYTPSLSSATLTFVSRPQAPGSPGGVAASTGSILWSWTDASSGQNQEDQFRIYDLSNALKATAPADATSQTETGLAANTSYDRYIQAVNSAGSNNSSPVSTYTLSRPPQVTCNKSTGVYYMTGTTFTFTNANGFGPGGVQYYRYAWDTSPTHSWSGSEAQWTTGLHQIQPPAAGAYYLHVRSYNGNNSINGEANYGPYLYDTVVPSISFNPPTAPWQNTAVSVDVTLGSNSGSPLKRLRHQWTASTEPSTSSWSAWDISMSGMTSAQVTRSVTYAGVWYLHVELENEAGNMGNSYGGPYSIDLDPPTGSIMINGGAGYTPSRSVTLNLTYSDSASGPYQLALRNEGGEWSPWEGVTPSKSWNLPSGEGMKTVEYQLQDAAGNLSSPVYSDSIEYDTATTLEAADVTGQTTGENPGEGETFTARASLRYAPTNDPLSSQTLSFTYKGVTRTGVTNGDGEATANFNSPSSAGSDSVTASFAGDPTAGYGPSNDSALVAISSRPTILFGSDVNASAGNPFTAQARLKDFNTGNVLSGKTISFTFNSETKTDQTDALGIASTTFTAPVVGGTYPLQSSFAGSPTYAPAGDNAEVAVGARLTLTVAPNVATLAKDTFTATANLYDRETNNPLLGETLSFTYRGETKTAVTAAGGLASTTFYVGDTTGTRVCNVAYGGTVENLPSADDADIIASTRPVNLVTPPSGINTDVLALDPVPLIADALDGLTGSPISGTLITFTLDGQPRTGLTDALGRSSATFSAYPSSTTKSYTASFPGGATYGVKSASNTLRVIERPTFLDTDNLNVYVDQLFTASATLTDVTSGAPVPGKTVRFIFNGGAPLYRTTNVNGLAAADFSAPSSPASLPLDVFFSSDGTYYESSDTVTIAVGAKNTSLTIFPANPVANSTFTLSAKLSDEFGGVPNKRIDFIFQGQANFSLTDSSGVASVVMPTFPSSGTWTSTAAFAGDAGYTASNASRDIAVQPRPILFSAQGIETEVNIPFEGVGSLKDFLTGEDITGATVTFSFPGYGDTADRVTDSSGTARKLWTSPGSIGAFSYYVSYAGNELYMGGTATGTVAVGLKFTILQVDSARDYALEPVELRARLIDKLAQPVTDQMVLLEIDGVAQSSSTRTDINGFAEIINYFTAPASSGTYRIKASFAGSGVYLASEGEGILTVDPRPVILTRYASSWNYTLCAGRTAVTVKDGLITNPETFIPGLTVHFTLYGQTRTGVSNASGIAYNYTFPSNPAGGEYPFNAEFRGNATYAASTIVNQPFTNSKRNTTVTGFDNTQVRALDPVPLSAQLTDAIGGACAVPMANLPVRFEFPMERFPTVTQSSNTNAVGISTSVFASIPSTGTYTFLVSFLGNQTYNSSNDTADVIVGPRPTSLLGFPVDLVRAQNSFAARVQLYDNFASTGVANQNVTITFQGTPQNVTTDNNGFASWMFTAPTATGTYSFHGSFGGSEIYSAAATSPDPYVNVVRRLPRLDLTNSLTWPALEPFNAQGELSDYERGDKLAGRTVQFLFNSVSRSAVTNALGKATTGYTTPMPGNYELDASFAGDSLYEPITSTATMVVTKRETALTVAYVEVPFGKPFTARATLRDARSGGLLSGEDVILYFVNGGSRTVVTVNGEASWNYTAPNTVGDLPLYASYDGDSLYEASSGSNTVRVLKHQTALARRDMTVPIEYSFYAESTLTDLDNDNNGIPAKTVTFSLAGQPNKSDVTDAIGVASVTYTAPSSAGQYNYFANFTGDAWYLPCSTMSTLTVVKRPTILTAPDKILAMDLTWPAEALLVDIQTGFLVNLPIEFYFGFESVRPSTQTSLTNASGVSTATYTTPELIGVFEYSARFYETERYAASQDTGSVKVDKWPSRVLVSSPTAYAYEQFQASATVTEAVPDYSPIVDANNVSFYFVNGGTKPASVTNANGNGFANYSATTSSGTYPLYASFGGNAQFFSSASEGEVTVLQRPTHVLAFQKTGVYALESFQLTAELNDDRAPQGGMPEKIAGKKIQFTIDEQFTQLSGNTDSVGIGAATFAGMTSSGTYPFTAEFFEDATFMGSSDTTKTVTIDPRPTYFSAINGSGYVNEVLFATATLKDG
ncbi:MAG: DUF2341 domain-containing protein, partial [Elusimicrobia bacterium]|nr:DUF2341 domain-containing protein [Elusimicrobiota bacterium]